MKKHEILTNGIRFVSHQLNGLHSVTISVSFMAGSVFESIDLKGVSHLIEHLYFRQLDDISHKDLYTKTYMMGSELRGATYNDHVLFSITVVPQFFKDAIVLMSKLLHIFHWKEDTIDSEKRVVLNQIAYEEDSYEVSLHKDYFKGTDYADSIMGTRKSVELLTPEKINRFKDEHFTTRNSFVAIVGNYSDNDYEFAKEIFSNIEPTGVVRRNIVCKPKDFGLRTKENRYTIYDDDSEYSRICVNFDVPEEYDNETVRLISCMLGSGYGSLLGKTMREENAYTDELYCDIYYYYGISRISVSYTVDNLKLQESLNSLFNNIALFKTELKEEWHKTNIVFFTDNFIKDYDDAKLLSDNYILFDFVLNGSVLSEPMDCKQKYGAITYESITKTAKGIFSKDKTSVIIETSFDDDNIVDMFESAIDILDK